MTKIIMYIITAVFLSLAIYSFKTEHTIASIGLFGMSFVMALIIYLKRFEGLSELELFLYNNKCKREFEKFIIGKKRVFYDIHGSNPQAFSHIRMGNDPGQWDDTYVLWIKHLKNNGYAIS